MKTPAEIAHIARREARAEMIARSDEIVDALLQDLRNRHRPAWDEIGEEELQGLQKDWAKILRKGILAK